MKRIAVFLLNNIFEILGLIGLTSLAVFWTIVRDIFIRFIHLPYSGWMTAGLLSILLLLYIGMRKLKEKKTHVGVFSIPQRPNSILYTLNPTIFGVKWQLFIGTNKFSGYLDPDKVPLHDLYGYIEGPYCLMCDYELDTDRKKNTWQCARHKAIKIPKNIRDDTDEKVTKLLEADFRRQRKEGKV